MRIAHQLKAVRLRIGRQCVRTGPKEFPAAFKHDAVIKSRQQQIKTGIRTLQAEQHAVAARHGRGVQPERRCLFERCSNVFGGEFRAIRKPGALAYSGGIEQPLLVRFFL